MSTSSDNDMRPKVILITGCSYGGIGEALTMQLYRMGHRVFATMRSLSESAVFMPHQTDANVPSLTWLPLDVTDEESIKKCVANLTSMNGGRLDILINNAGIGYSAPLLDADMAQAKKVFDVNYFGVLAVTQAFAPMLIESKGRVVNISSIAEFSPVPWLGVYNSSKAALGMFSDTLRLELQPFGVKVINVLTGGIKSNMNDNNVKAAIGPESFYYPNKTEIERIIRGEVSLKHQTSRELFAAKVAKHILSKNPSAQLLAGEKSTSMWLLSKVGGTIWGLFLPRMFGLKNLKPNVEETMARRDEKEELVRAAAGEPFVPLPHIDPDSSLSWSSEPDSTM
ncbi:NAD(P)-binding protein [Mollisia scopiformis]|uniref:NAD(P)-binding protein n=1 Tax=Mollisia scopiformis TaxID=149040 RepID=A0A194XX64_MOLSC|nr:NAD(P)-binding protein [Mollisia scopiformis]KUJ24679.1 NAD(P)-binding protein [Mollisia scopiformis]